MATRRLIFKVFVVSLIVVKGVITLEVEMNPNITAVIGNSNTSLWCSYRNVDNVQIFYLQMYAKNTTTDFFPITKFYPPSSTQKNANLTEEGNYLKERVTLTNPTNSVPVAILLFDEIQCKDGMEYRCTVVNDGTSTNQNSNTTKVTITNRPKRPDKIELVTSPSEVVEGQNVSFSCKGDVGNPPGTFVWKKYRNTGQIPETYSNIITTHEKVPDNCTYYGTSLLSIQLTSQDNFASFKCVEESLASFDSMGLMTGLINVYYQIRNVTITKTPDMETYPADLIAHLNLTCNADGNPAPMYSWFREEIPDTILSETNTLNIKDLTVNKSGNYVCSANNTINNYHYNKTARVNITIGSNIVVDTKSETITSSFSSDSYELSSSVNQLSTTQFDDRYQNFKDHAEIKAIYVNKGRSNVDRMHKSSDNKMDTNVISTELILIVTGSAFLVTATVVVLVYCCHKRRCLKRNKTSDIVSASNNQSIPLDSTVELSTDYATVKDKNKMEPTSSTGQQKNEYADVEIRDNFRSTQQI